MKKAIIKQLVLAPALFVVASCSGRVDLESLKMGEKLPLSISDRLAKDGCAGYLLDGYRTEDLSQFRLGKIKLASHEFPAGHHVRKMLYIFNDNYEDNHFLGFYLSAVNEEEHEKIYHYLEEKYRQPNLYDNKENFTHAVWIDDADNKWILLERFKLEKEGYWLMNLTVVRQGTRIGNSKDENVFTILEKFKRGKFGHKIPLMLE